MFVASVKMNSVRYLLITMQNKTSALDDIHSKYGERDGDLERTLREKEEELEIYKSGMDQTLLELNELKMVKRMISMSLALS